MDTAYHEKNTEGAALEDGASSDDYDHARARMMGVEQDTSKAENSLDQSYVEVPPSAALDSNGDILAQSTLAFGDHTSTFPPRSESPAASRTWQSRAKSVWRDSKGVVLMVFAQFFGSAMAAIARLMETDSREDAPLNPMQILFARQSVTVVLSLLYMWWAKVPEAPLGPRAVRPMLALRGFGGFFGVFGLYFSLMYLPLADAIVITFIAPMLAAYICSVIMQIPFTRTQRLAGLVSIVGVVLITQPVSLFSSIASHDPTSTSRTVNATLSETSAPLPSALTNSTSHSSSSPTILDPTPAQRALAVLFAVVGVFGASTAYVTLTYIGKRAHPLISVNYFATWCTLISLVALLFVPSVPFRLPSSLREWILLTSLGVSGFVMQFLLTASLAQERKGSGKVLNIVYVQMVFALGFDRLIWGTTPGWVELLGGGLILGSVIWVAVKKDSGEKQEVKNAGIDQERGDADGEEERQRLVEGEDDEVQESEDSEMPSRPQPKTKDDTGRDVEMSKIQR